MIADRELAGLPVRVHYPDSGHGPFPLVLFSHGLGGSRLAYGYLGKLWSSLGCVAIHPSHRESRALKLPVPIEEVAGAQGAARLEALRAMKEAIDDPRNWEARPRDLAHVLDALDELPVAALKGKLDRSRVLIAGHSYGAYTTLLCAGARLRVGHGGSRLGRRPAGAEGEGMWTVHDFYEKRACAFLAMSPPGNGSRGLGAWSWPHVHGPMLCLTGSEDGGLQGQPPEWRTESFAGMAPGDKTLIVLEGVQHFTFSGGRPRKPADPTQLHQIEAAVRWFTARHLLGERTKAPHLPGARIEHK